MAPSVSVAEYFAGKCVLVTGATGFMGKVLVEKLLRCCPDLDTLYLLMRPKRGQGTKERLEDFMNCKVFERVGGARALGRLRAVPGDILAEDLGVSAADRAELQQRCHVLIHCAACVRFDMPLRGAVNLNTVGTSRVLQLAEGMEKLEVFLHTSTAYSRCELDVLEERLYPSKHRPQHVMDCVNWMDDELLDYLQPKIIEPQPNTYAYTKSLTEDLVAQYAGKFPIVIARPSIVTAAYQEPVPGWVDNLNGPTGLMVGAGKGVIRTMHCNESYLADIVPVDLVVNGCILLAYLAAVHKPKEVQVCNITESGVNPITWGAALDMGRLHVKEFPFSTCMWYPGGSVKSSYVHHQVALLLTHLLPAYLIDFLMFLLGKKTFMVKVQKRITYGLGILQYYTTKEWHFRNDNFLALRDKISPQDNAVFYTDIKKLNWNLYLRDYLKGAREYCCKEDPSTLPQARRLNQQLYYADAAAKAVLYALCGYFLYYYVTLFMAL